MVAHPFFCLKISHFKATVRQCSASVDVKTGSPDPEDFAKTRRPLAYHAEADAICQVCTNNGANCQHSQSCFLCELPQVSDPFFMALAVRLMVV
jgi:hypothetical protein